MFSSSGDKSGVAKQPFPMNLSSVFSGESFLAEELNNAVAVLKQLPGHEACSAEGFIWLWFLL